MHTVLAGKALRQVVLVLLHALHQVGRHADIERAAALAGENVDGGLHGTPSRGWRGKGGMDCRAALAMTEKTRPHFPAVIASEARRSSVDEARGLDCRAALAMTWGKKARMSHLDRHR